MVELNHFDEDITLKNVLPSVCDPFIESYRNEFIC